MLVEWGWLRNGGRVYEVDGLILGGGGWVRLFSDLDVKALDLMA